MDASPAQAANALAEVEGGSPAAVVLCPGLRWIWSLLIALSVIKIECVLSQGRGADGVRGVCCSPPARLLDTGHPWWPRGPMVAQAASPDPRPHTQGLLLHCKKITFIHNRSVPNPCGAWTAHVQHFDVCMCGLEFVLSEPCSSYPTQTTTCVNTQFSSPRMLLFKPTQWQRIPKEQQNLSRVVFFPSFSDNSPFH